MENPLKFGLILRCKIAHVMSVYKDGALSCFIAHKVSLSKIKNYKNDYIFIFSVYY